MLSGGTRIGPVLEAQRALEDSAAAAPVFVGALGADGVDPLALYLGSCMSRVRVCCAVACVFVSLCAATFFVGDGVLVMCVVCVCCLLSFVRFAFSVRLR
jgi:hypothetical protein